MYPEVEQYITTRDAAAATYQAVIDASNEKYRGRYNDNAAYDAWRDETREADRVQRIAVNEAWNALTDSSDPLVKYIAEQCKEYQGYAIEVLKVLPASLDKLDDLAYNADWCNVWNRFRDQAVEAGLFGKEPQGTPARQALHAWAMNDYGMGRPPYRQLTKLVDAIVAEALNAKAASEDTVLEAPASA